MKRFISAILAALCILLIPVAAHALNLQPSALTVIVKYGETPLNGIHITLCRVADAQEVNGTIVYNAIPAFSGFGAGFAPLLRNESAALDAILNILKANTAIASAAKLTDSDGKAVFAGLPAGLYLVTQKDAETCGYRIAPFIVAVPSPNATGSGWNYNVTARPKVELVKTGCEAISISVYVIWSGTSNPPGSVSVQLYRNGSAYGTPVLLNNGNFWKYVWTNLDPNWIWTVDEPNVPAGYIKSISGNPTNGFIITNTKVSIDVPQTLPIPMVPGGQQPAPGGSSGGGPSGSGPKTDDSSNMRLWILLILAASAGLLTAASPLVRTLIKKRRRCKGSI